MPEVNANGDLVEIGTNVAETPVVKPATPAAPEVKAPVTDALNTEKPVEKPSSRENHNDRRFKQILEEGKRDKAKIAELEKWKQDIEKRLPKEEEPEFETVGDMLKHNNAKARAEAREEFRQEREAEKAQEQSHAKIKEAVDALEKKRPGALKTLDRVDEVFSDETIKDIRDAVADSEFGLELALEIMEDAEFSERLERLSPRRRAFEIYEFEKRMTSKEPVTEGEETTEQAPTVSKNVPKPLSKTKGKPGAPSKNLMDMAGDTNLDAFMEQARKVKYK